MINWDAKVNTVADHHQAVKAVVAITPIIRVNSISNHITHWLLCTQPLEDMLKGSNFSPACGSINDIITVLSDDLIVNMKMILNKIAITTI